MKILGQPADYSEILQRIFYTTVASGVVCTVLVAKASPAFEDLINAVSTKADIGPIKGLKVLYVLIPALIGLVSRMLKLHDRISDVFRIRSFFDTRVILYPLARDAGVTLTKDLKKRISDARMNAMYAIFYPYAGFRNPVIDEQLVRTAADNWGWFWVLTESSSLFLVTAGILACVQQWNYVFVCLAVILVELILMSVQGFACRNSAQREVVAILNDSSRKACIAAYFESL